MKLLDLIRGRYGRLAPLMCQAIALADEAFAYDNTREAQDSTHAVDVPVARGYQEARRREGGIAKYLAGAASSGED